VRCQTRNIQSCQRPLLVVAAHGAALGHLVCSHLPLVSVVRTYHPCHLFVSNHSARYALLLRVAALDRLVCSYPALMSTVHALPLTYSMGVIGWVHHARAKSAHATSPMFDRSVSSLSQAELIQNSLHSHTPFKRLNLASLPRLS
jgi:hypothetical protein